MSQKEKKRKSVRTYKFIIRGPISALKNDRAPIQTKDGRLISVPNATVQRNVKHIQASFQRQMQKFTDEPILFEGVEVAFLAVIGVYTAKATTIPNKDTDNMVTTIQEAMQGTIVPPASNKGDRLVKSPFPHRRHFLDRNLVHTVVWVWESTGTAAGDSEVSMKLSRKYGV